MHVQRMFPVKLVRQLELSVLTVTRATLSLLCNRWIWKLALSLYALTCLCWAYDGNVFTQVVIAATNLDGTPFLNGTVVFTPVNLDVTRVTFSVTLDNSNNFSVGLAPTDPCNDPSGYYEVVYYDPNGFPVWTERWEIPMSIGIALQRSDVLISDSRTLVDLTSSSNPMNCAAGLPLPITNFGSLNVDLGLINSVAAGLTNTIQPIPGQVASLTSSVAGANTQLTSLSNSVATMNTQVSQVGTNLASTASAISALQSRLSSDEAQITALNGQLSSLNGSVSALQTSLSASTSQLQNLSQSVSLLVSTQMRFADNEVPAGKLDGTNLVFTLVYPPSPSSSLAVYRNGVRLQQGTDFTNATNVLTFSGTGSAPQPGDNLTVSYRY